MLSDRGVMLREGTILDVTIIMQPTRQAIEATLKEVSNLGFAKREKTPWACTVRTCRKILKVEPALWTFLDHPDVEPTNNAAERALRPAVIHRKLSYGVQSQRGALCQSRLLTWTTSLKQQGRDLMAFVVEAWGSPEEWSAPTQPAPPARLSCPSVQSGRPWEAGNNRLVMDPLWACGAPMLMRP